MLGSNKLFSLEKWNEPRRSQYGRNDIRCEELPAVELAAWTTV
jgi:hypothetical protein